MSKCWSIIYPKLFLFFIWGMVCAMEKSNNQESKSSLERLEELISKEEAERSSLDELEKKSLKIARSCRSKLNKSTKRRMMQQNRAKGRSGSHKKINSEIENPRGFKEAATETTSLFNVLNKKVSSSSLSSKSQERNESSEDSENEENTDIGETIVECNIQNSDLKHRDEISCGNSESKEAVLPLNLTTNLMVLDQNDNTAKSFLNKIERYANIGIFGCLFTYVIVVCYEIFIKAKKKKSKNKHKSNLENDPFKEYLYKNS